MEHGLLDLLKEKFAVLAGKFIPHIGAFTGLAIGCATLSDLAVERGALIPATPIERVCCAAA